MAITTTWRPPY